MRCGHDSFYTFCRFRTGRGRCAPPSSPHGKVHAFVSRACRVVLRPVGKGRATLRAARGSVVPLGEERRVQALVAERVFLLVPGAVWQEPVPGVAGQEPAGSAGRGLGWASGGVACSVGEPAPVSVRASGWRWSGY